MSDIAVIADVHGNDLALEAVLADIDALGITEILNLGDHLSGPLNAARTADLLIARDFPSILGNHDRALIALPRDRMGLSDGAAFDELSPRHLDWLRSLPATRLYRDTIFMCHGTPSSDETYWLEQVTPDGHVCLAERARIEAEAQGIDAPVILCGHTHIARAVSISGGRLVVNPGSVGCSGYIDETPVLHQVETGSPHARCAVLSATASGWQAAFRMVAYDHAALSALAGKRGRPEWASALETGRVA